MIDDVRYPCSDCASKSNIHIGEEEVRSMIKGIYADRFGTWSEEKVRTVS